MADAKEERVEVVPEWLTPAVVAAVERWRGELTDGEQRRAIGALRDGLLLAGHDVVGRAKWDYAIAVLTELLSPPASETGGTG